MIALVAVLLAGTGLQGGGLAGGPTATPTTKGGNYVTATTANVVMYVATTGSDAYACTTLAAPCKTIQAAINKIPKLLRHSAIVNVAAGSYAGFYVSGFSMDLGIQTVTAGIMVTGPLVNSTNLTTGTATGTATSGTAGAQSVFGLLNDTNANWVIDNLQGRFLAITAGTGVGQLKAIASNTATSITISGYFSAIDATSVYAIQDPSVAISSCIKQPPSASGTQATTFQHAIRSQSNAAGVTVMFRNLSITGACPFGIYVPDVATVQLQRIQFTSTSATVARALFGGPFFVDSMTSIFPSTGGLHVLASSGLASVNVADVSSNFANTSGLAASAGTVQFNTFVNGATGLSVGSRSAVIATNKFINMQTTGMLLTTTVASSAVSNAITCTSNASAVGISFTSASQITGAMSHNVIDGCATGLKLDVRSNMTVSSLAVLNATVGVLVNHGSMFVNVSTVPTFTSVTNEVSLDNGAVLSTWGAIAPAPTCLPGSVYGSLACQD